MSLLKCLAFATLFLGAIEAKSDRKMILLMVDGFADFYLRDPSKLDLNGFEQLSAAGVTAKHLVPIFPTLTIPNLYSLATGLYAESHGLTGNNMWDPSSNEHFEPAKYPAEYSYHWWNRTEPIWVTAERQGISTALLWWHGCQVKFPNASVTYCLPYKNPATTLYLKERIPQIVSKLDSDEWQFVLIFYEDVDYNGHKSGPHSGDLKESLMRISDTISSLQQQLGSVGLLDKTDLIVMSDHGMVKFQTSKDLYFIDDFIEDMDMIEKIVDYGAILMIYPFNGEDYRVYQELTLTNPIPNVTVYWTSELPDRWHWKKGPHIAPIVLVADLGVGICTRDTTKLFPSLPSELTEEMFERGQHGYDNIHREMRGIFMARGPDFKENFDSDPVVITDVYQILCHILDIECHRHNGTWANVFKMLKPTHKRLSNAQPTFNETDLTSSAPTLSPPLLHFAAKIAVVIVAGLFIICPAAFYTRT